MASTEPRTHRHGVDGLEIAFWDQGEGTTVVFFHGNFASKRWFLPTFARRPEGARYLAPDLPNFGESDDADRAELAFYADTLGAWLDALDLDRFLLVGHSMGGGVAQALAAQRPDTIERLLLISSPPPSGFPTPPGTADAQRAVAQSAEQMGAALAATMPTRTPDDFEQIVQDGMRLDPDVFEPHNASLADMDLTEFARGFEKPVWILRCERDYLITEAMAREAANAYPNADLLLWDDIGHSPQIEDPERFQKLLVDFLEGAAMT